MIVSGIRLRNLLLPPAAVCFSLWLGAILTSLLCQPGEDMVATLTEQMWDRWEIELVVGDICWSGASGLIARRVRFSKRMGDLLVSGGFHSLWISLFQDMREAVHISCHRPQIRLRPLNRSRERIQDDFSIDLPWPGKRDWRLPSVYWVVREGTFLWEGENPRSLENVAATIRFTGDGVATVNLTGALDSSGANQVKARVHRDYKGKWKGEFGIKDLDLHSGILPLPEELHGFEGTLTATLLCQCDTWNQVEVDTKLSVNFVVPGWFSSQTFYATAAGSFHPGSGRFSFDHFDCLLPGKMECRGGEGRWTELGVMEASLEKFWISEDLLDGIQALQHVNPVVGEVELSDMTLLLALKPDLRINCRGKLEARNVSFSVHDSRLAARNVSGKAEFYASGTANDLVLDLQGVGSMGGLWMDDLEWSHLTANGAIQVLLPSGTVSSRELKVNTISHAEITLKDSWVDLKRGRLDLNIETQAVRMDQLLDLAPNRMRDSLLEYSLWGLVQAKASVTGFSSADGLGPSEDGLGCIQTRIDVILLSAGMDRDPIKIEVRDALNASIDMAIRKSQIQGSLRFQGQDVIHTYRGAQGCHDLVSTECEFLVDSSLGVVQLTSACLHLDEEIRIQGNGYISAYDTSMLVRGLEGDLSSWHKHFPEIMGWLPPMHRGRLGFEIRTAGPLGQAISGHAILSNMEYLYEGDSGSGIRADQIRVDLDPMGMSRRNDPWMEARVNAFAKQMVWFQQGRVVFEAEQIGGTGKVLVDPRDRKILLDGCTWTAEELLPLSMEGGFQRAREGYEGGIDWILGPFPASALSGMIPGFQHMGLEGILEAQGRLFLGEGTRLRGLIGVVRTHSALSFHLTNTIFKELEGELPFAHGFVRESVQPGTGELRAQKIIYDDIYVMEKPWASGYYVDGTLVAEMCNFGFAGGRVEGHGSVHVFDAIPFDFSVRLHDAKIDRFVDHVRPLMGRIFVGPIDGHLEGSGVKDRFHSLDGHLESRGGWLSARQFQERVVPLVPVRPLGEIMGNLVGLLRNMRLEVDLYEQDGLARYQYRIIDPMGLVKEKGESLITIPMDILVAFIRSKEE